MDSESNPFSQPLWFGTPWHGLVYRLNGSIFLRPVHTGGPKDRPWSRVDYERTMSIWDIGKTPPETPDEIVNEGGKFLGRSLFSPRLSLSQQRSVLLDGVVCRVGFRSNVDGIEARVSAFNAETGRLDPAVIVTSGSYTNDDIGQGAGQPIPENWTPPVSGYANSMIGIDATADGRSTLIGITGYMNFLHFVPLIGLLRLDISGTPSEPNLVLSLVMDRREALGTSTWSCTDDIRWIGFSSSPDIDEYGPCGRVRSTRQANIIISETEYSASSTPVNGKRVIERGVSGRLLSAWFNNDGTIHAERFNWTDSTSIKVTHEDASSGFSETIYRYDESCRFLGADLVDHDSKSIVRRTETRERKASMEVAGHSISHTYTQTSVSDLNARFSHPQPIGDPVVTQIEAIGTYSVTLDYPSKNSWISLPPSPGIAPPTDPGPVVLNVRLAGVTDVLIDAVAHPGIFGWKCVSACITRAKESGAPADVDVIAYSCATPSGINAQQDHYVTEYKESAGLDSWTRRRLAASNGAYNPLTGEFVRGAPGEIIGVT